MKYEDYIVADITLNDQIHADIVQARLENLEAMLDCMAMRFKPFKIVEGYNEYEEAESAMYGENL